MSYSLVSQRSHNVLVRAFRLRTRSVLAIERIERYEVTARARSASDDLEALDLAHRQARDEVCAYAGAREWGLAMELGSHCLPVSLPFMLLLKASFV